MSYTSVNSCICCAPEAARRRCHTKPLQVSTDWSPLQSRSIVMVLDPDGARSWWCSITAITIDGSCPVTGLHGIFALDDCHFFLLLWLFPCPVALLLSWISLVMLLNSVWRHDKIVMREFCIAVFGFWTEALWGRLFLLCFFLDQDPPDILLLTDHCFARQPLTDSTDLCCQTESVVGGAEKVRRVLFLAVPCQAKHCFSLHKYRWSLTPGVDCFYYLLILTWFYQFALWWE